MMRVVVLGAAGQIGREVVRSLHGVADVEAVTRARCDLTDDDALRACLRTLRPDLVVNAAAYTAVDRAETERSAAERLNTGVPRTLVEEARRAGFGIIHYSTDYVFNGQKATPYTEDDAPDPVNFYGHTKAQGDAEILSAGVPAIVFRTSWVYSAFGNNFVRTILRLAAERDEIRVVDDQIGAPTWSRTVAALTAAVIARAGRNREDVLAHLAVSGGLFNLTASGVTSWYGFAQGILAWFVASSQRTVRAAPIKAAEYRDIALRPANCRLDCSRLNRVWGLRAPDWKVAIEQCLDDLEHGWKCAS